MRNKLIRESNPSIYTKPMAEEPPFGNNDIQLIVGNLNGNVMKLLYLLVKYSLATINEEIYFTLGQIFQQPIHGLSRKDLNDFSQLLDQIKFKTGAKLVLLDGAIGGMEGNDYFTLVVIQKLVQSRMIVKTHLSSANAELHQAYNCNLPFNNQASSTIHMDKLLKTNLITRDVLNGLIKGAFLPTLVPFSYQLTTAGLCIRTPFTFGLDTLQSMAKKLKINYKGHSARELATVIDVINKKYNPTYNFWAVHNNCIGKRGKTAFEVLMSNSAALVHPDTLPSGERLEFVHLYGTDEKSEEHIYSLQDTSNNLVALYCNSTPTWQTALARASRNALSGNFYGLFKWSLNIDKPQSSAYEQAKAWIG